MADDFCHCDNPRYVPNEVHQQYGGQIVSTTIGEYCTNCGGIKPPDDTDNA